MCLYTILRWVINALILMLLPHVVPGVEVANFFTALVVAIVLAFVNAVIRPIIILLTLPINILTLGLFTLFINGFMFWFVSNIVKGFDVSNFWSAFLAALVYSILSILVSMIDESKETTRG